MPSMRTDAIAPSGETTRERILAAAARLFAHTGYEATTVKDIARECDLTDPAIYYHFQSKREILNALLVAFHFEKLQMRSISRPTRELLAQDLYDIFSLACEHASLLRVMFHQGLDNDEETRLFSDQTREQLRERLNPVLEAMYRDEAEPIFDNINALLVGIQLEALLEFDRDFHRRVRSAQFAGRVRQLLLAVLPETEAIA
jgi:AcrR family transcriptional regulator